MKRREARLRARRARSAAGAAALLVLLASVGCDVPTALPRFENTLALPAPDIGVPVTGFPTAAIPVTVDLRNVDEDFADRARGGEIEFTPQAPQSDLQADPDAVSGTLQVTIRDVESTTVVTQTVTIDGYTPMVVSVDEAAMQVFLGGDVEITVTGSLGPSSIPTQTLVLATLVRITFEVGGE